MNFNVVLLISLSALFSGGAFSSFFCIIFAKIFKKKYLKARFSIIFVFLSVAIASFTADFFIVPDFFALFPLGISDLIFFGSVFVIGMLATAFWKVALPVFLVFYIGFTVFFGFSLYNSFGVLEDTHKITVTKSEIFIDDEEFPAEGASQERLIEAEVFVLDERILLPLPRVWYKLKVSGSENSAKIVKIERFTEKIIKKQFTEGVDFPQFSVLPAVFTVKCERNFESVNFFVEKSI